MNYKNGDLVLHWNHEASWDDYKTVKLIWRNKDGNGGTHPLAFLELIHSTGRKAPHLIVITDGEIIKDDVQECASFIHANNILFTTLELSFKKKKFQVEFIFITFRVKIQKCLKFSMLFH